MHLRRLTRFVDAGRPGSLAARLRARRFALFHALLASAPGPLRILDVGGTEVFWERMGFAGRPGATLVLVNRYPIRPAQPGVHAVVADANRPLPFRDASFDVVFSNSLIEHLDRDGQRGMADEVRRLGRRYFVQTPNRRFPIEPHFALPFWQFLPVRLRVALVQRFAVSWYDRIPDRARAERFVRSFRLLSRAELLRLFPGAALHRERLLGLTKSFVVYGGWDQRERG